MKKQILINGFYLKSLWIVIYWSITLVPKIAFSQFISRPINWCKLSTSSLLQHPLGWSWGVVGVRCVWPSSIARVVSELGCCLLPSTSLAHFPSRGMSLGTSDVPLPSSHRTASHGPIGRPMPISKPASTITATSTSDAWSAPGSWTIASTIEARGQKFGPD